MAYKKSNANGQATMANSEPVVIASDQSAVTVDLGVNNDVTVTSGAITETNSAAIKTAVEILDNAIAGTEMQVDVVASLPAGTNNIGDVDVLTVNGVAPAFGTGVRGATVQRVTIATDDSVPVTGTFYQATQPVSLASVPSHAVTATDLDIRNLTNTDVVTAELSAVDNAVLDTIDAVLDTIKTDTASIVTATQLIDDTVFADDAAVTLGTSKGNISEGVAVATDGTDPTAVSAEGDAAALRTDMNRLLIVNQTHPRFWHVSADYASAQTNASVKAAPGASLSLYITDIQVSNGATAGNVTLLDGSGGTVLYEVYPAINGGAVLSLRSPIKLTANTALCITSTTVTTHSVFVSGYIAA